MRNLRNELMQSITTFQPQLRCEANQEQIPFERLNLRIQILCHGIFIELAVFRWRFKDRISDVKMIPERNEGCAVLEIDNPRPRIITA